MPNLGAGEILVILLLALLVLGPDKLPGAARSIGKTMSQVRKLSSGFEQEVRSAMHSADPSTPATPASPEISCVPCVVVWPVGHPAPGSGTRAASRTGFSRARRHVVQRCSVWFHRPGIARWWPLVGR